MGRLRLAKVWATLAAAALIGATAVAAPLPAAGAAAAAADEPVAWTPASTSLPQSRGGLARAVHPRQFSASVLDVSALSVELPRATAGATRTVGVPGPDGVLQDFVVAPDDVMAPALAAAHPEIRTFAGHGVADPTLSIRLDVSPLGFHASVRGPVASGTWYVDPAYVGNPTLHVSYYGSQLDDTHGDFVEASTAEAVQRAEEAAASAPATGPGAATSRRTFGLALVSDPSYAQFFGGAANVTAAKVALINRVSQVYNDDLSITLQLVAGTDSLNLSTAAQATGANGPCGAAACFTSAQLSSCSASTLNRNTAVINAILGSAAYDVGHLALGTNGGGLADLGVVGSASAKGGGCTGVTSPVGDLFAVDYVAHELGHQFGAGHTFNGVTGSCGGGNRVSAEAVEPGSGSSVMAYAGICAADNLQEHSDPYFSEQSLQTINAFLDTIPGVGTSTPTANHNPVVTAPAARTIPFQTPFALTGSAADADGNALGYSWEQDDTGSTPGTALLSNTKTNGPLFRMFGLASTESGADAGQSPAPNANHVETTPTRVFPDLTQVLAGNTNAATGTCPAGNVDCFSEFLPTAAWTGTGDRVMHFRLTARDAQVGGAGVGSADTAVTVSPTAGPFLVSSRSTPGTSVAGGSTEAITWSVNGTDAAGLAPFVRISLSTDGGQTYPIVLAAQTANDGSRTVAFPNTPTAAARVKVEAVDNYFFDVNDAAFSVTPGTAPGPDPDPDPGANAPDVTAPDTAIYSGPSPWVLTPSVALGLTASETGSAFACSVNGVSLGCGPTSASVPTTTPGRYLFSAAARDPAGNTDVSAATQTWSVPYGASTLARKGFALRKDAGAFAGKVAQARRKGATLTRKVTGASAIVLVATTARGAGKVKVYLGGRRLRTVDLAAARGKRKQQVISVASFGTPASGKVTIVTANGRPVRIEGLGWS